jgi:hypothetical protein
VFEGSLKFRNDLAEKSPSQIKVLFFLDKLIAQENVKKKCKGLVVPAKLERSLSESHQLVKFLAAFFLLFLNSRIVGQKKKFGIFLFHFDVAHKREMF